MAKCRGGPSGYLHVPSNSFGKFQMFFVVITLYRCSKTDLLFQWIGPIWPSPMPQTCCSACFLAIIILKPLDFVHVRKKIHKSHAAHQKSELAHVLMFLNSSWHLFYLWPRYQCTTIFCSDKTNGTSDKSLNKNHKEIFDNNKWYTVLNCVSDAIKYIETCMILNISSRVVKLFLHKVKLSSIIILQ